MAHNVFVSYKFKDNNVQHLYGCFPTTARDYVNKIEEYLAQEGHIYYGEHDDEDLSNYTDEQIWNILKDKIYPTTCTIVLISPQMKNNYAQDRSQWIPWEVCYSIRETTRGDRTSRRNGILAVVLPDQNGSYEYALSNRSCCLNGCVCYNRDWLFTILKENMFNQKEPIKRICEKQDTISYGEYSYIPMITWRQFVSDVSGQIERVERIKDRANEYQLHLSVNK